MQSRTRDTRTGLLLSTDDTPIQVLRPRLPPAERLLSYLHRIDTARTYTNGGSLAVELEERLAERLGLTAGGVTLASSGTTAIIGAILATTGRAESSAPLALVPAFTFIATALAAEQGGFRAHIVDVDADTWALQAAGLERHGHVPRTGLVIPVAPFGRAVPQAPWLEFRRRTGIPVVIDGGASIEAIGADPERFIGPIPVALSFHATKSFSTAEGGCVLTTDGELSRHVGEALNFGFAGSRDCVRAGTNGKMSEYHAAVGLAELDAWDEKRTRLLEAGARYRSKFADVGLVDRLIMAPDVATSYVLFRSESPDEAERVIASMSAARIESRRWYGGGLHRHAHLQSHSRDVLGVTEGLAPCLVALPVAPDLSTDEIRRVAGAVAKAVGA